VRDTAQTHPAPPSTLPVGVGTIRVLGPKGPTRRACCYAHHAIASYQHSHSLSHAARNAPGAQPELHIADATLESIAADLWIGDNQSPIGMGSTQFAVTSSGIALYRSRPERANAHRPCRRCAYRGRAPSQALRVLRAAIGLERGLAVADLSGHMMQSVAVGHGRVEAWRVDEAGTSTTTPAKSVEALPPAIKVLVVDDDRFMRDLLYRVLAGAGMVVACHGSATELLASRDMASANVLLLDVKMPDISGLDLQDLLRRRGVDLPVVFISGAADLAMAVTAMRNGAADFIEKPFEGAALIERILRAVARHADHVPPSERREDPLVLARFETLTPRERQIFDLLVTGMTSKVIARELGGSFRTIEIHRAQIMRKMRARHLPELVRISIESMAPRRLMR
jgi:FixJ family two-component response regulator